MEAKLPRLLWSLRDRFPGEVVFQLTLSRPGPAGPEKAVPAWGGGTGCAAGEGVVYEEEKP